MKYGIWVKITSLLLVCASVLVMFSCGKKENNSENSETPKIEVSDYNTVIGNDTNYDYIYQTKTGYYVFEIVGTKETAEEDAKRAGRVLSEKFNDIEWFCCVVDENEIFLGEYNSSGYTPFVYEKSYDPLFDVPPFTIPFDYYWGKYMNGMGDKIYYESDELRKNPQGVPEYTFTIRELDPQLALIAKLKMKTIADLMSKTLQNNVIIKIIAFEGTADEIIVEASHP